MGNDTTENELIFAEGWKNISKDNWNIRFAYHITKCGCPNTKMSSFCVSIFMTVRQEDMFYVAERLFTQRIVKMGEEVEMIKSKAKLDDDV